MKSHAFSYFYLHKFLIYFQVFILKILSLWNCISDGVLFFVYLIMLKPFYLCVEPELEPKLVFEK
jgi:hypothetical protein